MLSSRHQIEMLVQPDETVDEAKSPAQGKWREREDVAGENRKYGTVDPHWPPSVEKQLTKGMPVILSDQLEIDAGALVNKGGVLPSHTRRPDFVLNNRRHMLRSLPRAHHAQANAGGEDWI